MRFPAPVGGLNFAASTISMPETDCYLMDNLLPSEDGVRIRKGWKYWVPQGNNFAPYEVRTLMTYNSKDATKNKLFACPSESDSPIYDITTVNVAPVKAYTPVLPPNVLGEWYYTNFVTNANTFLCVVAAGSGYHIYDDVNGWRAIALGTGAGQVSFPAGSSAALTDLCFITVYKSRLWFLRRNSTEAYYLPIGSITGALQLFDFGPTLRRGGNMSFITSWNYDSGDGMDDSLVAISNKGDTLIYSGIDPGDASTFSLNGVWYIGRMPYGRRNFAKHGGDVVVATEYGIIKMSELVAGKLHTVEGATMAGFKVNPNIAPIVSSYINVPYWFLFPYPTEELLILGTPYINPTLGIRQSYVMGVIGGGWATISNMDPYCCEMIDGKLIFGTRGGDVCQGFYGYRDATSSDDIILGQEVTGRFQGAFLDFRDGTKNKRLLRCKVYGLTSGFPSFYLTFKPEYELSELINTPSPVAAPSPSWDSSVWDGSIWLQDRYSLHKWFGVAAFGKKLSMQMAIRGAGEILLTDFEVLFEQGIGL